MMKCLCSKCEKPFEYKSKKQMCTCPHCGNEDYVEINNKLFETRKQRLLTYAKNEYESLHNYKKAALFYESVLVIDNECCFSLMRYLLSKLFLSDNNHSYILEVTKELELRSENIYLDDGTVMYLKDALSTMRTFIIKYVNDLRNNICNDDDKSFYINALEESKSFINEYINVYNGIDNLSQFLNEPLEILNEDLIKFENMKKDIKLVNKSNFLNYSKTLHKLSINRLVFLLITTLSIITMVVGFIMLLANISLVIPASIIAVTGIILFVIFYSLSKNLKTKIDKIII